MATKKALVLGADGQTQQLQAGDTLGNVSETGQNQRIAGAILIAGNPVYCTSATGVNKAQANAAGTSKIMGLAATAISSAAAGTIQTNGIMALTTTEWDAVAGTTGGLTFGTIYFASAATAGLLTATPPTTVGQYVARVGRAISTTEIQIDIDPEILL